MQDNLEFLQWAKRYWDQYYPGGDYDAIGRRKAAGSGGPMTTSAPSRAAPSSATRRAPTASAPRMGGGRTPTGGPAAAALQQENAALKETVTGLERERDFYFSKLRDIELLIQQAMEADPELEKDDGSIMKQIQTILYSTEEGFEIPAEAEGELGAEEETF
jgi:microtubule-associated protein, RP/EB family